MLYDDGRIQVDAYDVIQVKTIGSDTWEDYTTIRDASEASYAVAMVERAKMRTNSEKYRIIRYHAGINVILD